MPTVPRLTRQVAPTALPSARLTASETFASTGVGVAEARADAAQQEGRASQRTWGAVARFGGALMQASDTVGQIVQAERLRADQTLTMDAENQLSMKVNALGETALSTKGKHAMGVPEQTMAAYNTMADLIASGLTNERQRVAFSRTRANTAARLDLSLRRHVSTEMENYADGEAEAKVSNAVSAMAASAHGLTGDSAADTNTLKAISYDLKDAVFTVRQAGQRKGKSDDEINASVMKVTTAGHVGVIEALLANEQVGAAQAYFEEARDAGQMNSGEAQSRVVKALESGSLRKRSQDAFDAIVDTKPEAEWIKESRKIDDAQLRDEVEQRVQHQLNINERATRESHEKRVTNAKNIIDQTGDWRKVPPQDWDTFTVGESGALRSYAEHRVTQVSVKTDPGVYHFLSSLAMSDDPAQRAEFVKLPMMGLVNRLSPSDWQQFVDAQGRVRKGDIDAANKMLVNVATQNNMVNEALLRMGMDPSPQQPGAKTFNQDATDLVNDFRRRVRTEATRIEEVTKKPVTDADVQMIVDRLAFPGKERPSGAKGMPPLTYRFEAEGSLGRTTDIALGSNAGDALTVTGVPAEFLRQIIDDLARRKKPLTDANIVGTWNNFRRAK